MHDVGFDMGVGDGREEGEIATSDDAATPPELVIEEEVKSAASDDTATLSVLNMEQELQSAASDDTATLPILAGEEEMVATSAGVTPPPSSEEEGVALEEETPLAAAASHQSSLHSAMAMPVKDKSRHKSTLLATVALFEPVPSPPIVVEALVYLAPPESEEA